MIRFESDYLEGAHPQVLKKLCETNLAQTPGYMEDEYCEQARQLIRKVCCAPDAAVHFLVGGTQVNRTVVSYILRPHQGVISAETGHIACHETGTIESSGHKVLTLPGHDGKINAMQVEEMCRAHYADASFEHTVQPGMVYISNPTETGTVYTRSELEELYAVCRKRGLPLYIDGARLGTALHCEVCDYTLPEMTKLCDAFTIGGTKMGALFGEALVIMNPELHKDFRYYIKQNTGMFAKGRLLGIQFLALLEDGLYDRIGEHEVRLAMKLKKSLIEKGWSFWADSPTNQQFVILPNAVLSELKKSFAFNHCCNLPDDCSAVRFCTSWATTEESIETLLDAIPAKA